MHYGAPDKLQQSSEDLLLKVQTIGFGSSTRPRPENQIGRKSLTRSGQIAEVQPFLERARRCASNEWRTAATACLIFSTSVGTSKSGQYLPVRVSGRP